MVAGGEPLLKQIQLSTIFHFMLTNCVSKTLYFQNLDEKQLLLYSSGITQFTLHCPWPLLMLPWEYSKRLLSFAAFDLFFLHPVISIHTGEPSAVWG